MPKRKQEQGDCPKPTSVEGKDKSRKETETKLFRGHLTIGGNARHAKEILEGKSALNDIWKQMRVKKNGSVVVRKNC